MDTKSNNSRRDFISSIALGAAAGGLSMLTNPLQAETLKIPPKAAHEAEAWLENIKGKHRVAYDGSTPHDGLPVVWNWAFYHSNNLLGVPDEEITAMTVLRHSAIPFALEDRIWDKYNLGAFFGINDNSTGNPSKRNTVYEPQDGDFPVPGIDGIKRMQERGALFCVCNLALNVYGGFVAQSQGLDGTEVFNDFVSGVLPGIQIVPSGVWALGRAQEKGCGYIFAGN